MMEPENRLDLYDEFDALPLDTVPDVRYPSIVTLHRLARLTRTLR
jgi:hypothetical protein